MKYTRSCIFVVTIILLLVLFTACDIFFPGYNDYVVIDEEDEPEDEAEDDPEDDPEDEAVPPEIPQFTPETPETSAPVNAQPGVTELIIDKPVMVDLYSTGEQTILELTFDNSLLAIHAIGDGYDNEMLIADMPDGYVLSAYYVKSYDGYPFVTVSYDYISDDFETSVIEFSGYEPECNFRLPLYVTEIEDDYFTAYGYVNAVGTWAVSTSVYFVMDSLDWRGVYELDQQAPAYMDVDVAMNLPVKLKQNGEYKDSTLLPGAPVSFIATDAETYMEFELWDGTEGIFYFEWDDDWFETINGVSVFDYFHDLPQFG